MTDLSFWLAALLAGFFGSTHCVGMCGGIAGVLTHAIRQQDSRPALLLQSGFHLGRIGSYCLLALVLAVFSHTISELTRWQWWADLVRVLAACMLVFMGLFLTQWWNGLFLIEKWGAMLWRRIQPPFLKNSSKIDQTFISAVLSGGMWGLLPCGLVYSALLTAGLQGSIAQAGVFMLLFGLGTVPALLLSAFVMHRASASGLQRWRKIGGMVLILFGFYVLLTLIPALFATESSNGQHQHHHHSSLS